jgi:hypothetical protein
MLSLLISFAQSQANEHPFRSFFIILLLLPLSYFVTNEYVRRKARISGFDGPPGKPVFGNIPDIKYNAAEKVVVSCMVNALTNWRTVSRMVENLWRCVSNSTRKHSCHCLQFGRIRPCSVWTFLTSSQLEARLVHLPQGTNQSRQLALSDCTNLRLRYYPTRQGPPSEHHLSVRVSNVVAKVLRLR